MDDENILTFILMSNKDQIIILAYVCVIWIKNKVSSKCEKKIHNNLQKIHIFIYIYTYNKNYC